MFTTPSRTRDARSSTPLAGAARSTQRASRAGTPVFGSHDPVSPPSFLSPVTFRRDDTDADVSSGSLFLNGTARARTSRARPRPSSMLAATAGPSASLLSPNPAFDREGSVISEDADMRSVADTVHSAAHANYSRRAAVPAAKDANTHLEEGTILLGDQWLHVSAYSRLPTEVLELLAEADMYIDAFQGHLDVQTGYAAVVSRTQCFVWNYASRGIGTGAPTCFVFPVPEYASSSMWAINDLSHACFLPRGGAEREPALLLVTPDGQTRLWEGISSSLTRHDRAQRLAAPLASSGEAIAQLQRLDEATVVLATSASRLLRVSVGSRAGVLQAEIRPFTQPRGLLGRIFGATSAMGSANDAITAIAVAPVQPGKQGREVYAIGRKMVQKWHVLDQGGERLVAEQDVQQVVASSVLQLNDERYSAAQSLTFDLLDGAVQADGKLVLLFAQTKTEHAPLQYGLATLDVLKDAASFVVAGVQPIKYTSFADPRPYATPSLSMPNGGPAAFVAFADAVVAKQLEAGCESFEEVVKLKDDVKNRFIGTGCDAVDVGPGRAVAALSLISAASGALLVETSIDAIRKRCTAYATAADRQRADTERLQGKIEQALYYSESALNPLTFRLPEHLQGTLMTACQDLSRELLTFANPIAKTVPPPVDLRAALRDRLGKLRVLVEFVAACGHLEKLPQSTKRQLRADAELAAALAELWVYQNEFYSASHGDAAAPSPLARAIETVMAEQGLGVGTDDVVRRFFRHHADLTTRVLDRLLRRANTVAAQPLRMRSTDTLELNRTVLSAFRAALRYRKEHGRLYGIDASKDAPFEAWTAQSGSVQLLETLFSISVNLIPDRTRELGSAIDASPTEYAGVGDEVKREQRVQAELKAQLCTLAEIALACYDERLRYLTAAAAADAAYERELSVFSTTLRSARPLFVRPLVAIGRSDRALALAEQYHDFRTLVELCHEPSLRSSARIDAYLDRYAQPFAFELYAWLLEHGQPRVLLEQKQEHAPLVLAFLEQPGHDRLGWLHDLALRRFDAAAGKLERLALGEDVLAQRKLMLSLAKLGVLSTLTVQDLQTVGTQKQIEFFDDHLDLVAVQESLTLLWENALGGLPSDLPAVGSAEARALAVEIVDTVATRLGEYPGYRERYIELVQRLLFSNRYLGSEDLVDLLTLKDTPDNQLEDFATAVKVVLRAKDAPGPRLAEALRAVWRRAVLRDDWFALSETTNVSDQTVLADLQATALYALLAEVLAEDANRSAYLELQDLVADEEEVKTLVEARMVEADDALVHKVCDDRAKEQATLAAFLEDTDLPRLANELARIAAAHQQAEQSMALE